MNFDLIDHFYGTRNSIFHVYFIFMVAQAVRAQQLQTLSPQHQHSPRYRSRSPVVRLVTFILQAFLYFQR
jgi:hypothetical protein